MLHSEPDLLVDAEDMKDVKEEEWLPGEDSNFQHFG